MKPNCGPDQVLMENGGCKKCSQYYRPDSNRLSCVQDTCGPRQMLTMTGECKACNDCEVAVSGGTMCQAPKCGNN